MSKIKPLGQKAYGSIPHLPGSRLGPGDHHCHEGQAKICTDEKRDRRDVVWVQEKLDGSNVAVARLGDEIVPLIRAGYRAIDSRREMHHVFHDWAMDREAMFRDLLDDGERICGEWLALAHGTRYEIDRYGLEPFVAFDIMRGQTRATWVEVVERCGLGIATPATVAGPLNIRDAHTVFGEYGAYMALDPIEGYVWRVERNGRVDFLAKYVRPEKSDGSYLTELSGLPEVWNWHPSNDGKPPVALGNPREV